MPCGSRQTPVMNSPGWGGLCMLISDNPHSPECEHFPRGIQMLIAGYHIADITHLPVISPLCLKRRITINRCVLRNTQCSDVCCYELVTFVMRGFDCGYFGGFECFSAGADACCKECDRPSPIFSGPWRHVRPDARGIFSPVWPCVAGDDNPLP